MQRFTRRDPPRPPVCVQTTCLCCLLLPLWLLLLLVSLLQPTSDCSACIRRCHHCYHIKAGTHAFCRLEAGGTVAAMSFNQAHLYILMSWVSVMLLWMSDHADVDVQTYQSN
jgi:hypothetical protein